LRKITSSSLQTTNWIIWKSSGKEFLLLIVCILFRYQKFNMMKMRVESSFYWFFMSFYFSRDHSSGNLYNFYSVLFELSNWQIFIGGDRLMRCSFVFLARDFLYKNSVNHSKFYWISVKQLIRVSRKSRKIYRSCNYN
jgi:hypothetical protein